MQAVNIHSKHKAAARAWIDWFIDKSGYAAGQPGRAPALKSGALPPALKPYQDAGVQFIELSQAPKAHRSRQIDNESEIGLNKPRLPPAPRRRGARRRRGSLDGFFADLNKKWAATRRFDGATRWRTTTGRRTAGAARASREGTRSNPRPSTRQRRTRRRPAARPRGLLAG